MNGDIARLAEQAAQESFDTEHDSALEVSNDEVSYQIPAGFIRRFAELIVEECCNVLQSETIRHDGYGYNQGALHNKIKEHFGVES